MKPTTTEREGGEKFKDYKSNLSIDEKTFPVKPKSEPKRCQK